jgi:hypothetical protein
MINYGKILLMHEKDNPSTFLRATYMFSNVGDLVKCYGRSIRFPDDKKLYEAEMKLAIADILMQCRMMMEEHKWKQIEIDSLDTENDEIESLLGEITYCAGDLIYRGILYTNITTIIINCYALCDLLEETGENIEHMGFIHVMEKLKDLGINISSAQQRR